MNRTKTVPVLVSALTHINGCGGEILRRTGKRPKPPDTKIGIKSGKERKTEPSEEKNQKNRKIPAKIAVSEKYVYICSPKTKVSGRGKPKSNPATQGEMPEWSIGPHSKCGVRATVPGVRIPLSPQQTLKISKLQNKHPVLHPRM